VNSQMTGLASQKLKVQVVFSCLVVVGALLVTWLILGDSSPLNGYFTRHNEVSDTWRITAVVPFLLSAVISGNPHSPPMALFIFALIIQWSLLGYFLSIPMTKLWTRLKK